MRPTRPSSPSSTPSYRRWASPIVRFTLKRSLRIASPFLLLDRPDAPVRLLQRRLDLLGVLAVRDLNLLFALTHEACIESWRFRPRQSRVNRPIFFLLERSNL